MVLARVLKHKGLMMPRPGLARGWTNPTQFTGRPPRPSAEQLILFPRQIQIEYPCPDGKDVHGYVQADNERRYYLKIDQGGMPIRANEWLSCRIAETVGISVPRTDFIQTYDGDIAFASEEVDGVSAQADSILYLERPTLNELGMGIPGLQDVLSSVHAFDLFVNNVDRHIGNLLVHIDGDRSQVISIDFSRAFFWRWPWVEFPSSADMTYQAWVGLREQHGFNLESALATLDRLRIVSASQVEGLLEQMPVHWLSEARRTELLAYCRDGGWVARVDRLRKGLVDGSIV